MNAFNAFQSPLLIGFIVALGVGLLIGVERERSKGSGPARAAAGVRTFALVALLGAIAVASSMAALVIVFAFGVALFAAVSYWRSRDDDPGLTTEVALLVSYALGVLAIAHPKISAALGVAVALLLASRSWLHEFISQRLSDREILDGILLAAAALIVLPLLPDHALDAYGVVNPHLIWRLTVLMLLINAAGYVAMRTFKQGHGMALAGFFGGFVSSTATIAAMAAHGRNAPALMPAAAAAAALSSVATVLQLTLVLYLANPVLANSLLPALAGVAVVAIAYGLLLARRAQQKPVDDALPGRAFELRRAFGFALLVTLVMFISGVLVERYGTGGASLGVALAGFADTHSAAASAAALAASGSLPNTAAVLGILLAVSTNTVSKTVVAFVSGGATFGLRILLGLVLMMIALWGGVALRMGW